MFDRADRVTVAVANHGAQGDLADMGKKRRNGGFGRVFNICSDEHNARIGRGGIQVKLTSAPLCSPTPAHSKGAATVFA